jgi:hypothetical protein
LLRTTDGRDVFRDSNDKPTVESGSGNKGFEFIEGQHPDDDKEELLKTVSAWLGVQCI